MPYEPLSFADHLRLLAFVEAGSVRRVGGEVSVFTFRADPPRLEALDRYESFGFVTMGGGGVYELSERGTAHLDSNFGSRNKADFTLPEEQA